MKLEVRSQTDWFLTQFWTAVPMVPLLSIGLSSIFRVFDVNVALCTITAARSRPSGCWRMVTSDGIKTDWERFSKIRARLPVAN